MHVLVSIAAFAVHVTESVFLNIITNGPYTCKHYIVVAADSSGTLKSACEENICYT
jgi:hypothetical protein